MLTTKQENQIEALIVGVVTSFYKDFDFTSLEQVTEAVVFIEHELKLSLKDIAEDAFGLPRFPQKR